MSTKFEKSLENLKETVHDWIGSAREEIWGKPGTARERHESLARHGAIPANDTLLSLAKFNVNDKLGAVPEWAPKEMQNPDPRVQCASTMSNLFRRALLVKNVIESADSTKHRDLEQVLVTKWVEAMKAANLAVEVPRSQVRPGDAVVGIGDLSGNRNNNDRHVGLVGDYDLKNGGFQAYSNSRGTLKLQSLDDRFGHYREQHFYRLFIPRR